MLSHNLFKQKASRSFGSPRENLNWNLIIKILLENYRLISEIEGIDHQKIGDFLTNTLSAVLSNNFITEEGNILDEFKNGCKDLEGLGYSHADNINYADYNNETTKPLKLLFVMTYLYKRGCKEDPCDSEIIKLITKITAIMYATDIGSKLQNSLMRIANMPKITNYNDWVSCPQFGDGWYSHMNKNGWNICCELLLPIFRELECEQANQKPSMSMSS